MIYPPTHCKYCQQSLTASDRPTCQACQVLYRSSSCDTLLNIRIGEREFEVDLVQSKVGDRTYVYEMNSSYPNKLVFKLDQIANWTPQNVKNKLELLFFFI